MRSITTSCDIPECSDRHYAKGYCSKHYQKIVAYGDPLYGWEKHGLPLGTEYVSWCQMRQRCLNPGSNKYPRYGGRGITICPRWYRYANFYADMGKKPCHGSTLGRIDNDGNYEPDNCRWETPIQQANNTSRNVFLTYKGERLTIAQWSRKLGFGKGLLEYRLKKGWDVERALNTPTRKGLELKTTG